MAKGQMFVVGAVLLVVVLALFRQTFIVERPAVLTADDLLDNVEKELRYTAGISDRLDEDKLFNLSGFFRDNVGGFEGIYILVFTENDNYQVRIGNYLRARIDGTVQASGSSPSSEAVGVNDRSVQELGFDASGNVTLVLSYTKGGETITESLAFDTNGATALFYDISIKENDKLLRRKDTIIVV
jgi:hypothetical protein